MTMNSKQRIPLDWNSFLAPSQDGEKTVAFHTAWKNWLDDDLVWQRIEAQFRMDSGGFTSDRMPIEFNAPGWAGGMATLVANNRYDNVEKKLITEKPLHLSMIPMGIENVKGYIDGKRAIFRDAYGEGVDLLWMIGGKYCPQLHKLVQFNRMPRQSIFEARYLLDMDHDASAFMRDGKVWVVRGGREIEIKEPKIWDSSGRVERINGYLELTHRGYELVKQIPKKFFYEAVYPVFADYFPDAGTGSTSVDGHISVSSAVSWADAHGLTTGTPAASSVNAITESRDDTTGGAWDIKRCHYGFDTSAIDDGDTVTAATLTLNVSDGDDGSTDQYAVIVSSSPAANNDLAAGDFDGFGTTEWSDQVTIATALASFPTPADITWTLNATGRSNVSLTSVTNLGWLIGDDVANTAPASNVRDRILAASADTTGTGSDPELLVTSSGGGGSIVVLAQQSN